MKKILGRWFDWTVIRIRNAPDYDDFYIVNKEETKELLEFVESFLRKTEEYITKRI